MTSSGGTTSPYGVRVRSAMTEVVRLNVAPSLSVKVRFAVDRPHVARPNGRRYGRWRNAIVIASPLLATPLSVSTATFGDGRRSVTGDGTRTATPPFDIDAPPEYSQLLIWPVGSMK